MLIVFYSIIVAHLKNLHKIQLNVSGFFAIFRWSIYVCISVFTKFHDKTASLPTNFAGISLTHNFVHHLRHPNFVCYLHRPPGTYSN